MNLKIHDPVPALLSECDRLDYAEMCRQSAGVSPQLLRFALAMFGVGATVVALWLVKAWG